MKKHLLTLGAAGIITLFCGCQSFYNGGFISDYNTHATTHEYKVLGNVQGKSTYHSILCCVEMGQGGFIAAYKDALARHPDADDVIDIKCDASLSSIPIINLFYSSQSIIIYGKAVKYKERIERKELK